MKKFMKGVRFTPKNYSDEVEAKIQHYKKEGYNWANFTVPYCVGYEDYKNDIVEFSNAATYNLENGAIVKTKLDSEGSFKKNVKATYRLG